MFPFACTAPPHRRCLRDLWAGEVGNHSCGVASARPMSASATAVAASAKRLGRCGEAAGSFTFCSANSKNCGTQDRRRNPASPVAPAGFPRMPNGAFAAPTIEVNDVMRDPASESSAQQTDR